MHQGTPRQQKVLEFTNIIARDLEMGLYLECGTRIETLVRLNKHFDSPEMESLEALVTAMNSRLEQIQSQRDNGKEDEIASQKLSLEEQTLVEWMGKLQNTQPGDTNQVGILESMTKRVLDGCDFLYNKVKNATTDSNRLEINAKFGAESDEDSSDNATSVVNVVAIAEPDNDSSNNVTPAVNVEAIAESDNDSSNNVTPDGNVEAITESDNDSSDNATSVVNVEAIAESDNDSSNNVIPDGNVDAIAESDGDSSNNVTPDGNAEPAAGSEDNINDNNAKNNVSKSIHTKLVIQAIMASIPVTVAIYNWSRLTEYAVTLCGEGQGNHTNEDSSSLSLHSTCLAVASGMGAAQQIATATHIAVMDQLPRIDMTGLYPFTTLPEHNAVKITVKSSDEASQQTVSPKSEVTESCEDVKDGWIYKKLFKPTMC